MKFKVYLHSEGKKEKWSEVLNYFKKYNDN